MAKRNLKVIFKKSLAILSSAAMIVSFSTAGLITASAADSDSQSTAASLGRATKMYIYDEYGNDISETPIVYIDNSSAAGQATSTKLTAKIVSEDGKGNKQVLTEGIDVWMPAPVNEAARVCTISSAGDTLSKDKKEYTSSITVRGCGYNTTTFNDPITGKTTSHTDEVPYAPGKETITFTSEHGDVSRQVDVIVQEPATDVNLYYTDNRGIHTLDLNDYNFDNISPGLLTTANHKYQFTYNLVTAHPSAGSDYLDKLEWYVFEGDDNTPTNLKPTKLAEINQDGLFTPKENGIVWIVAKFAPTEKIARKDQMAKRAAADKSLSLKESDLTTLTADEYKQKWRDNQIDNTLIPYLFTKFSSPFPEVLTDRPFAVGNKVRGIYSLVVDADGNIVRDDNGRLKYKTDESGAKIVTVLRNNYEADRAHYRFESGYYGKALYADPKLDSFGNPIYKPIMNIPKYARITIRKENPAKDLKISKFPTYMEPGDSSQLEILPTPTHNKNEAGYEAGATDEWRWVSENPDIVSVDGYGVVTAHKEGAATIKVYGEAQRTDGSYVSASCNISVLTKATSIKITPQGANTRIGVDYVLTATAGPEDATDEIEWTSTHPEIATVTPIPTGAYTNVQKAKVTGVTIGTTEIIAKSKASGVESNHCIVTVGERNESDKVNLQVNSEDITVDELDLFTNHDIVISGALKGADGKTDADDAIHWDVINNENDNVNATIDPVSNSIKLHGIVKTDPETPVVIRATSQAQYEEYLKAVKGDPDNGVPANPAAPFPKATKEIKVNVKRSCDSATITRNGSPITGKNVNVGGQLQLSADLRINGNHPYNHDDKIKEWYSMDPSIATVDNTGRVTAVKNGFTNIFVTTDSGVTGSMGITAFTTSTVSILGVTTNTVDDTLSANIQLNANLEGALSLGSSITNENYQAVDGVDCNWLSHDENVATVTSPNGLVMAKDIGAADITLSSGKQMETCTVNVYAPISAASNDPIPNFTYSPSIAAYEPHFLNVEGSMLTLGKGKLTTTHELREGIDYTAAYTSNTGVGAAAMTLTGQGSYFGEKVIPFNIVARDLNDNVNILYSDSQECTGQAIVPEVTLTCDGSKLEEGKDYVIALANNVLPGTATMTITGMGSYTGSVTKEFEIFCNHTNLVNSTVVKKATYEGAGLEVGTCAACGEQEVKKAIPQLVHTSNPATELFFDKKEYGVSTGETLQLTPTAITANPSVPATDIFRWESENPAIATVSDTGVVTGVAYGKTNITVYGEYDNVVATCEVGVVIKLDDITVKSETVETREGIAYEVKAAVSPEGTTDELVWEIADTSVATVAPSETDKLAAIVTGVKVGQTKLIVKGKYTGLSKEVDVKVSERYPSDIITITTPINDEPVAIPAGSGNEPYTYKIFTNQDIEFTSLLTDLTGDAADDTTVWQVTNNEGNFVTPVDQDISGDVVGDKLNLHAASLGTVTITAYPQSKPNDDSVKFTFKLEVAKRCEAIAITDEKDRPVGARSLNIGDHQQLKAVLTINDQLHPFEHGDDVRNWTSSDPEVAEVDNSGYITAKKDGEAVIYVTTLSNQTAGISIYVFTTSNIRFESGVAKGATENDLPTASIVMNELFEGALQIGVTIYNQNEAPVGNRLNTWTSSDPSVATVDDTGLITAHNIGTSTIKVRSGNKEESFILTVSAPIGFIKYDPIEPIYYDPTVTEYKPQVKFTLGTNELIEGVDYDITYANNTALGNGLITLTGKGNYTGTALIGFEIVRRPLTHSSIKIDPIPDQNYTGEPIGPEINVTCNGVKLVKDIDYSVTYSDNIEEGTATATISALYTGGYDAITTTTFKIIKTTSGVPGDVDNDGTVTAGDALMILRSSTGLDKLTAEQESVADMNGDGAIDSSDALTVLRLSLGL